MRKIFAVKFGLIALLIILIDQLSKYMAGKNQLVVFNSGASFGLADKLYWPPVILAILGYLIYQFTKATKLTEKISLVIIIASGLSNLLDRVVYGSVRDFIRYPIIHTIGNLADVGIVIGLIVIALSSGVTLDHCHE